MAPHWMVCGDGFLGSEFVRIANFNKIPEPWNQNMKYTHLLSSTNKSATSSWLEKSAPSILINAAGPANVNESFIKKDYYLSEPVDLVKSHMEILVRMKNPPIYVYLSSAAVYGETPIHGASEMSQTNPISPYGFGKLDAESFLHSVSKYGVKVVVLRVFSSYSSRLASRLPHVIWEKFSKGGSVEFSGDGSELRDFIHTSDIVSALKLILDNVSNADFSVWNVASGKPISVKKIVELGANVFVDDKNGLNASYKFNNEIRPYDPKILLADVSKLSSIGFTAKIEPELGFDEFFRTIR